jgi:hypothetical protein
MVHHHAPITGAIGRIFAMAGLGAVLIAGCGGSPRPSSSSATRPPAASRTAATHTTRPGPSARSTPAGPPRLKLTSSAGGVQATPGFVPALTLNGQTAVWVARTASGVSLLSFDQRLVELHLHSGTADAGSAGWRFGPAVVGAERRVLLAAFNGGFRLSIGAGGFESYGKVAAPLRPGLGSIVTYADGTTDIGTWGRGLPAPGQRVVSVRQNLTLLIDHGESAPTIGCLSCWGATLNGVVDPARAALGVTADGRLIWAGGEHPTLAGLAQALRQADVVRAVELDINPEWVAAYLYRHAGAPGPVVPVPVMPGQQGVPGGFLTPWSRDFFTIVAR